MICIHPTVYFLQAILCAVPLFVVGAFDIVWLNLLRVFAMYVSVS